MFYGHGTLPVNAGKIDDYNFTEHILHQFLKNCNRIKTYSAAIRKGVECKRHLRERILAVQTVREAVFGGNMRSLNLIF